MRRTWLAIWSLALWELVGCAGGPDVEDESAWLDAADLGGSPRSTSGMRVASTQLEVALDRLAAVARIGLEEHGNVALEAGGLTITRVSDDRGLRDYRVRDGVLRIAQVSGELVVEYTFSPQDNGLLSTGSTLLWPYFCGNLYPCHSQPDDGVRFALELEGVPVDRVAIYPASISAEGPPYMLAWAVGDYTHQQLGTTSAGTQVGVDWLPGGMTAALAGTAHLVELFGWLETTLGPYPFGNEVRAVSVAWGEGVYGGMEHHPYWHVAVDAMGDEVTQAHEAAHGWFGDGLRLACWEDFLLSEGTASYLAARAIGQVRGAAAEAAVWADYEMTLAQAIADGGSPAWPTGCNQIDIVKDGLFTNLPYMQGAFFYKEVADAIGAEALDAVLRAFYAAHKGEAAGMQQMITAIESTTGFDTSELVARRLRAKF